ncbi:hypothetical protein GQ43DRAFT_168812 [Delitschia confertaspora ATCC 74209]|uniref:PHD-type domain-containing protein n=1 Tax=Delitschia confertaspora ATCC 74209 TaxID=1513339 RepID=A0A9P4JF72_9PLEO|nr:hypothetical protein GQ43DRAFT_168812 [Delitschia confertaspora ATCC 74209]
MNDNNSQELTMPVVTYEAAQALTALATMGSGQQYATLPQLPSPTSFAGPPRRQSTFSSHAAPIEPSPPIDQPPTHSPTLDQYHHSSKSPEEQRRQSLLALSTPPTVLAPLQNLTSVLNGQIHNEPSQLGTSYGKDTSQILPAQSLSSETTEGRDQTQNREPGFVRDEPTTSQIRQPESSSNPTPHPISAQLLPFHAGDQLPSPTAIIKNEPAGTPREATPSTGLPHADRRGSVTEAAMDTDTLKALEAVKQNELGLRGKKAESPAADPPKAPTKKRPAPKNTAANKKGTAKKPVNKKRKVDMEPDAARRSGTPSSRASKTPAGTKGVKKGSQAGTPALASSPAPDNSSQVHPSDEEADSSDDGTLYCICRQPDNHQWMIACDGGCDDWFHGACVNIQRQDEYLIDKYICPNCMDKVKSRTTWKPMCRRDGCRMPARYTQGQPSKYCSDECGVKFFREQLQRTAGAKRNSQDKSGKRSKKKQPKDNDPMEVGHISEEEEEPAPLGGVLRAKDVKALALASKDIESFRRLGSGVLTPPETASPTQPSFDSNLPNGTGNPADQNLPLTPAETDHLKALHTEKTDLQARLEMLKDREKFVSLIRNQAAETAKNYKPKEFCGYDPRLTWSDSEFTRWRNSKTGKAAFKFNTLTPTREQLQSISLENGNGIEFDDEDDEEMDLVNGDRVLNGEDNWKEKEREGEGICTRKGCKKHSQWQKINLQDARFEEAEVVESIRGVEKLEREVRERAARRGKKEGLAGELIQNGRENGEWQC